MGFRLDAETHCAPQRWQHARGDHRPGSRAHCEAGQTKSRFDDAVPLHSGQTARLPRDGGLPPGAAEVRSEWLTSESVPDMPSERLAGLCRKYADGPDWGLVRIEW
jgi:hypothetical protein